ncbi:MAG: hypothetical protein ACJASD_002281 [Sphingomonas echinoides]|jgi:hypothetical protein
MPKHLSGTARAALEIISLGSLGGAAAFGTFGVEHDRVSPKIWAHEAITRESPRAQGFKLLFIS